MAMLVPDVYHYCFEALEKTARADVAALLARKAVRKGVDPKNLGAIQQVSRIASGGAPADRSRAAQIAQGVRGYLHRQAG